MTYGQILVATDKLKLDQLEELTYELIDKVKRKRKREAKRILCRLKIGQTVSISKGDLKGRKMKVVKINRTKAVLNTIEEDFTQQYTVPATMINI